MNGNATTVAEANALALHYIATVIEGLRIPAVHRTYIRNVIGAIPSNYNFHHWVSVSHGPVVEVNTEFIGSGHAVYTLHIMLDADIPPDSKQQAPQTSQASQAPQAPHLGFEVKLNGDRVKNGHIWLPKGVLRAGRPGPAQSTQLQWYGVNTEDLEASYPLPVGLNMEVSFRRYRL